MGNRGRNYQNHEKVSGKEDGLPSFYCFFWNREDLGSRRLEEFKIGLHCPQFCSSDPVLKIAQDKSSGTFQYHRFLLNQ